MQSMLFAAEHRSDLRSASAELDVWQSGLMKGSEMLS
jgi:hypothetical protein